MWGGSDAYTNNTLFSDPIILSYENEDRLQIYAGFNYPHQNVEDHITISNLAFDYPNQLKKFDSGFMVQNLNVTRSRPVMGEELERQQDYNYHLNLDKEPQIVIDEFEMHKQCVKTKIMKERLDELQKSRIMEHFHTELETENGITNRDDHNIVILDFNYKIHDDFQIMFLYLPAYIITQNIKYKAYIYFNGFNGSISGDFHYSMIKSAIISAISVPSALMLFLWDAFGAKDKGHDAVDKMFEQYDTFTDFLTQNELSFGMISLGSAIGASLWAKTSFFWSYNYCSTQNRTRKKINKRTASKL